MKFKTLLSCLLCMIFMQFSVTSCGSDNDDTEDVEKVNNLIGMWREDDPDPSFSDGYNIFVFNEDYTGKHISHESIHSGFSGETRIDLFAWEMDEKLLTINYEKNENGWFSGRRRIWNILELTEASLRVDDVNRFETDHNDDCLRTFYRIESLDLNDIEEPDYEYTPIKEKLTIDGKRYTFTRRTLTIWNKNRSVFDDYYVCFISNEKNNYLMFHIHGLSAMQQNSAFSFPELAIEFSESSDYPTFSPGAVKSGVVTLVSMTENDITILFDNVIYESIEDNSNKTLSVDGIITLPLDTFKPYE